MLAVGAVFNASGTRDVSRQNLRQLGGIASESLAPCHDTIRRTKVLGIRHPEDFQSFWYHDGDRLDKLSWFRAGITGRAENTHRTS